MNYADFFLKNQAKEKKHRRRIAAFLVAVRMWLRSSVQESCLSITDSLKPDEAWDLITGRQCFTLLCRRHLRMYYRRSEMNLLFCLRKLRFPDISLFRI